MALVRLSASLNKTNGMNVRKMDREDGVETLDRWEGGERGWR